MRRIVIAGLAVALLCGAAGLRAQEASKGKAAKKAGGIKIALTSVIVNDQAKALKFYTGVLGFEKKTDIAAGGGRWITVVSPAGPAGVELALEPAGFPAANTYQKALFDAGIPLTAFEVDDLRKEHARLEKLGVKFRMKPTKMEHVTVASFEDTCGNVIQLYQP